MPSPRAQLENAIGALREAASDLMEEEDRRVREIVALAIDETSKLKQSVDPLWRQRAYRRAMSRLDGMTVEPLPSRMDDTLRAIDVEPLDAADSPEVTS